MPAYTRLEIDASMIARCLHKKSRHKVMQEQRTLELELPALRTYMEGAVPRPFGACRGPPASGQAPGTSGPGV